MYVYLDETTFGENDEYSGYGCLISKKRIQDCVITEALINLRQDSDIENSKIEKFDSRTLERKYFHAADDSKNGHSHLCNSINRYVAGKFSSQYFKPSENNFETIEDAYDLASKLSILEVFHESIDVTFIFEERNSLTRQYVSTWWNSLWDDLLKSQFNFPYLRTYYPSFEFEICSKAEPGLQVVDFILWASNRKLTHSSCKWFSRLRSNFIMEIKPEGKTWGGFSLMLGKPEKEDASFYSYTDYQHNNALLNSKDYLFLYIIHVQKVINIASCSGIDSRVSHFWDEIEYLSKCSIKKSNASHIEKMAICFLKLFDNVDVIGSQTSTDDKAFWLTCRKCFSFSLHTHDVNGRFHSILLSDIRNKIIDDNPNSLQSVV